MGDSRIFQWVLWIRACRDGHLGTTVGSTADGSVLVPKQPFLTIVAKPLSRALLRPLFCPFSLPLSEPNCLQTREIGPQKVAQKGARKGAEMRPIWAPRRTPASLPKTPDLACRKGVFLGLFDEKCPISLCFAIGSGMDLTKDGAQNTQAVQNSNIGARTGVLGPYLPLLARKWRNGRKVAKSGQKWLFLL